MKLHAVIFDMDGLLINSERLALQAFQEMCDHHAMGDQFDLYMQLLGTNRATTESVLAQRLDSGIDQVKFLRQWDERYGALTSKGVPLMTGVECLLDYLDDRGIPMAVATSTDTDKALIKLERAGVLHRFKTLTGGDQVDNGKPAPDIYLMAAESLAVQPAYCIALEDSANGIKAAVGAGMHAIQIPDMASPDEELLKLGHQVLGSLDEVVVYIDSLSV
ncbi:MAG: HAD family hydrolase [Granulosicoccus sp.]